MALHEEAKLKRLGHQLRMSEKLLQTHPLVRGKLTLLQTIIHYFDLQTEWSLAGSPARLLMTFQAALQGKAVGQSQTGFIGPALDQLQRAVGKLVQASLQPSERESAPLLLAFMQVIALGAIFISTQLTGNWKKLFPRHDPAAAQKASLLLRELGLTFILGSRAAEAAFRSVTQGLELKEESQEKITAIGMCMLLLLITLLDEEGKVDQDEFFEIVKHYLQPTLKEVEQAIQRIQEEGMVDEEQALLAASQLQLFRQALEAFEPANLKQTIESSLTVFGCSIEEIRRDLRHTATICSQINESFRHIFYQSEMTATTVTQAA